MGHSKPARRRFRIALALVGFLMASLSGATASSAGTNQVLGCPEITDSIMRLHLAYFNEHPAPTIKHFWATKYQTAEMNLLEIADYLATSDTFVARYGTLDDVQFLGLLYSNMFARLPDQSEQDHWLIALETGTSRGEVTLSLSESREHVVRTNTATPLAGYYRWYPKGVRWYCGTGTTVTSIIPVANITYVDYFAKNAGQLDTTIQLATFSGSTLMSPIGSATIGTGFTLYNWDYHLHSGDSLADTLNVSANSSTRWAVVFYPESIGSHRLGWQIQPPSS